MNHCAHYYDNRTFLIYVDSYDRGVPRGYYANSCRNECGCFESMAQLLLNLDRNLDQEGIPQAFDKIRTFMPVMPTMAAEEYTERRKGDMATFVLHILYRQNASWQGTLFWLDERKKQKFRSVLELISLMDSALDSDKYLDWEEPMVMAE